MSRAHVRLGQIDEAWRCLDEAMTAMETTKETWQESELYTIAGELTLLSAKPDQVKAQAHFERALAIARRHQAKSWELRAGIQLARLWRDNGDRRKATELLTPTYEWFAEGFGTPDLKTAEKLLTDLAA